jgi:hypothetical protein
MRVNEVSRLNREIVEEPGGLSGVLFNGKDLTGWLAKPHTDAWSVQNGCIVFKGNPAGAHFQLVLAQLIPVGENFLIEMDMKSRNMDCGFSLGGRGLAFNTDNAWRKICFVFRCKNTVNAVVVKIDGKEDLYRSTRGPIEKPYGWFSINVNLPNDNSLHEAWFRNIQFKNLP